MIELNAITKQFGRYPALHGIDLTVKKGEFIALLGPSGSGKTTLLRIIAGLEVQDGGTVRLGGEDVSRRKVAERGVGFVFQQYALFRHMTVAENIGFGLTVKPRLDARVRKDLRRWLRDLHGRLGITSIFVTHDQEEALELADRVVVMNQGRIEQVGTPEDIYMHPATPFVSQFVGETNLLPAHEGAHPVYVRPHEIEIVPADGEAVRVGNVFRKGGVWRIEGHLAADQRLVEIDADANLPPPTAGDTILIRPKHLRTFAPNGAEL